MAGQADKDLWVFGYGSLMWRPGFAFAERHVATVRGYHRALCVYSHVYRGTPEKPGLVLGLDRGGSCRGVAFRVTASERSATIDYLRKREQITMVYREANLATILDGGRSVEALTYVVDRRHVQYAGRLQREGLLTLVRQGIGISGDNADYVRNTHAHLVELQIDDPILSWLTMTLDGS